MTELRADFFEDLRQAGLQALTAMGLALPSGSDTTTVLMALANAHKRRVPVRQRAVRVCAELEASSPAPELRNALEHVFGVVRSGGDLTPYLSRKVEEAEYNDMLMHDWGIHHIHLRVPDGHGGLTKRRNELLFAKVTPATLYAIALRDHDAFWSSDLIEIIHSNWPEIIQAYRVKGVAGLEHKISDETRREFRKVGVVSLLQLKDGTVYTGPGGGYSTAGTGMRDLMWSDGLSKKAHQLQKACAASVDIIARLVGARLGMRPAVVELRLVPVGDSLDVYELSTGARLILDGPQVVGMAGAPMLSNALP